VPKPPVAPAPDEQTAQAPLVEAGAGRVPATSTDQADAPTQQQQKLSHHVRHEPMRPRPEIDSPQPKPNVLAADVSAPDVSAPDVSRQLLAVTTATRLAQAARMKLALHQRLVTSNAEAVTEPFQQAMYRPPVAPSVPRQHSSHVAGRLDDESPAVALARAMTRLRQGSARSTAKRFRRTGAPQQDREAAIRRIKGKILKAIPLVYWDKDRRDQSTGIAQVRFDLNRQGYVNQVVVETCDDPQIKRACYEALHLAEPYVYVPGWIELELAFSG